MSLLKRLFGGTPKQQDFLAAFDAEIAPQKAFFAVGDVHGCSSQMESLLEKIAAKDSHAPIVFVGDYVDRGEQSADVLLSLFACRDDPNMICLRGNHEEMMLDFISQPAEKGARWLRYGGLQTLASFGVSGVSPSSKGDALVTAAEALKAAMGPALLAWMEDLPSMWKSGNVTVVHAGADPRKSIMLQGTDTLAWGHRDFETVPRQDGIWVLHGHTIVDAAYARDGRIAIDTGAYATGTLTAAYVTSGNVDFLSELSA